MFLFILLLFSAILIYFLTMVCIQFNRINSLNLQFGMDVTKLYCNDHLDDGDYIHFLINNCAMSLFKINKLIK